MEDIRELIQNKLSALPGKTALYYKDLTDGEIIRFGENTKMCAASVIKLFVLAYAEKCFSGGSLDRNSTIRVPREACVPSCGALTYLHEGIEVTPGDLCTLMIIFSDNTATNILIDILGQDNINGFITELGFETTVLNRKMFEYEKAALGLQNYISAREVGELLEMMYFGELVSLKASRDMLRIMKDQQLNHKIPFFLESLEDAPDIAHKTGEDDGISHDAGIIFGNRPFILVLCGNETTVPQWERTMADLSLELYNYSNNKQ